MAATCFYNLHQLTASKKTKPRQHLLPLHNTAVIHSPVVLKLLNHQEVHYACRKRCCCVAQTPHATPAAARRHKLNAR